MRLQGFIVRAARARLVFLPAVIAILGVAACSNNEEPGPAAQNLIIVSGDNQYSKFGTELENPITLKLTLSDGKPGKDEVINFKVVEGGGTLSRGSATANSSGIVTVRWTLGPVGPQRMTATAASNSAASAIMLATSSEYYCPEEDPAFVRKFSPAQDLLLFTRQSTLLVSGGAPQVGIVQISPQFPGGFVGSKLQSFQEGTLLNVVRDCAFSANGSFYLAWTTGSAVQEIVEVTGGGTISHFATLDSFSGSEIDMLPGGVLAGCDEFGPFTVGCRDTLTRYDDAMFGGTAPDAANNDAMAVDPVSGDLYFIALPDRSLRRLPLDGYTQTGPVEEVVTLEIDEAYGAAGMVVDDNDGSVFILVESTDTRGIVKVTSAGVKTTASDFFVDRGAGPAAGIQSDLAIDQTFRQVYTLDTLNNVIVVYQIATGDIGILASSGDPGAASNPSSGERVGLSVMR
ncbi:MAG TPA: hypothetical protein VFX92_01890 [Candidatus Krumholzibacteria bacterium]|nr:hypothetical protein [Candidatus Krumholzibacteria bacterium]